MIKLVDFGGNIDWFSFREELYIDSKHSHIIKELDACKIEVIELSHFFQNISIIDEASQVPILKNLMIQTKNKYEQLYISCMEGNYFNADGQKNNIADRKYFSLVKEGHTVISEPIINRSTGKPIIAIGTPFWSEGRVIGLFGATLLLYRVFNYPTYSSHIHTAGKNLPIHNGYTKSNLSLFQAA